MSQKYNIIKLDWDTNFFGIKSAKINLNEGIEESDLDNIKTIINKEGYKFVTINNKDNNNQNNFLLQELNNVFLADVNIQFTKKIEKKEIKPNKCIEIRNNFEYESQILEITKESFIHSRFYNDKNLKNCEKIYVEWAKNSFNKDDKYFCVYKEEKNILGYVLFSIEEDNLIIELIAINNKEQSKRNRNKTN